MPRATVLGHVVGQTVKSKAMAICTGYWPDRGTTVPRTPPREGGVQYKCLNYLLA